MMFLAKYAQFIADFVQLYSVMFYSKSIAECAGDAIFDMITTRAANIVSTGADKSNI